MDGRGLAVHFGLSLGLLGYILGGGTALSGSLKSLVGCGFGLIGGSNFAGFNGGGLSLLLGGYFSVGEVSRSRLLQVVGAGLLDGGNFAGVLSLSSNEVLLSLSLSLSDFGSGVFNNLGSGCFGFQGGCFGDAGAGRTGNGS